MSDLGLGDPVAVEMGIGDAMLMDVRTFHYGSANTRAGEDGSDDDAGCRVQLSATFEEPLSIDACSAPGSDPSATIVLAPQATSVSFQQLQPGPDTGFTYELRPELRGKYVLGDFLPATPLSASI